MSSVLRIDKFDHICPKCNRIIKAGMKYAIASSSYELPCGKIKTIEIPIHVECAAGKTNGKSPAS